MAGFKCRDQCGECCGPVAFSKDEWARVKGKAVRIIEELFEDEEIVIVRTSDMSCVFLDNEKKCAIYGDRPQICRDYGVKRELPCPFLRANGDRRGGKESIEIQDRIDHKIDAWAERLERRF